MITRYDFDLESLEISQLGAIFNQLNRDLVTAQEPDQWNPAVAGMADFLEVLDEKLISKPDIIAHNHVDSSRAFSMLLTLIATGTQYRHEQFKPND